jgi:Rieske 2Fe-2S family protein
MQTEQEPIRYDERAWKPRPTLSGADYTSSEIFDEERERIWWGDWVCIGRTEELPEPGDYIVRDLAGESIFITRNEQGELHGFYNVCSHRGTKFLDNEPAAGHIRKAFVCPYHAWAYDLNGRLVGTPNVKEGELFDRSDYPLHGFAVESYAGFLFVSLAREPRPLMGWMGQGAESVNMFDRFKMDELRVGVRIVYEVEANWKIVVENYNECPTARDPSRAGRSCRCSGSARWDEETRDDGNWMRGRDQLHDDRRVRAAEAPGPQPEDTRCITARTSSLNLMLNLHPTASVPHRIRWSSHTTVVRSTLPPGDDRGPSAFKPEPVVELWDRSEAGLGGVPARRPASAPERSRPASTRVRTGSSTTSTSATVRRWAGRCWDDPSSGRLSSTGYRAWALSPEQLVNIFTTTSRVVVVSMLTDLWD